MRRLIQRSRYSGNYLSWARSAGGWRKPEESDRIQTARRPPEPRDIMPDRIRDARKNSKEFWLAQFRDGRGEGWRERKVAGLKLVFEPKGGAPGGDFLRVEVGWSGGWFAVTDEGLTWALPAAQRVSAIGC